MSNSFENFNSFKKIASSDNPLKELSNSFDKLSVLFWEYRFLIRDSALLMALDKKLKEALYKKSRKKNKTNRRTSKIFD